MSVNTCLMRTSTGARKLKFPLLLSRTGARQRGAPKPASNSLATLGNPCAHMMSSPVRIYFVSQRDQSNRVNNTEKKI